MTKQTKFNFFFFYKILLSISIIIASLCLIFGSLHIYFSGNGYSREIVVSTFSKISVPVYICLALIIGSFFINNKGKSKFYKVKNFNQAKAVSIDSKKLFIIKVVLIFIAVVAFTVGAICGGFKDVLTKAVNICTECIGLG